MAKKKGKGKRRKKKPPLTPEEAEIDKLEKQKQKAKVTIQFLRKSLAVSVKTAEESEVRIGRLQRYHDVARPYVAALETNSADNIHPVEYYAAVAELTAKKKKTPLLLKEDTDDDPTTP